MVGIIDPPRDEARVAIADASAAGIRVLMITGDHPRTAARIAGDLGIVSGDARVLAGDENEELDDEALGAAVGEVSVYARVAPEHKLRIVRSEEHTSELQSLMHIQYAVFSLKLKKTTL